jgi:sulfite reductase (ferredoxin)
LDTAIDYKLGDENNLLQYQKEIEALIKRVEELFNSLNAKLEFKLEPTEKDVDNNEGDEGDEGDDNESEGENGNLTQSKSMDTDKREVKTRDLRGVECPLNFVKAKLFIEPLPAGEIVDIYLDEGEPIKNVPQSLKAENHEILAREKKSGGYYLLKVKKGD